MKKPLETMTLEELWKLFPIFLKPYNPEWKTWFYDEETVLRKILPAEKIATINHIGSTAIGTIWAKPIVDILIELYKTSDMDAIHDILIKAGWRCMSQTAARMSFNKGYTENGFAEKVFHLHIRTLGDNAELTFRNYLITHPEIAKEYETLKLSLWNRFEYDRDGYTSAKTDFVTRYSK